MKRDYEVFESVQKELNRQRQNIELIASENFVSNQILELAGSVLTNKYAEGYPNKRYYGGCQYVYLKLFFHLHLLLMYYLHLMY